MEKSISRSRTESCQSSPVKSIQKPTNLHTAKARKSKHSVRSSAVNKQAIMVERFLRTLKIHTVQLSIDCWDSSKSTASSFPPKLRNKKSQTNFPRTEGVRRSLKKHSSDNLITTEQRYPGGWRWRTEHISHIRPDLLEAFNPWRRGNLCDKGN